MSPDEAEPLKRQAALHAAEFVRDGMVLGLGTGSTTDHWIRELGRRVRAGLRVVGVPSSRRTADLAGQLGIPLTSLDDHLRLDLTVDGADEITAHDFCLIKGGGGALLREKLLARASNLEIVIADRSKLVDMLGVGRPVPVEVVRFGWRQTAEDLRRLGCRVERRASGEQPFVSDEGHYVLDCLFPPIADPARLAAQIKAVVGVVDHGLFIGLADRLVIASSIGIEVLDRP